MQAKEEKNQIKLTTACHRSVVGNLLHLFFLLFHTIFFRLMTEKDTKNSARHMFMNSGDIKKLFDGHEFDKFELFSGPYALHQLFNFMLNNLTVEKRVKRPLSV
jgi:hypothetical protein